MAKPYYLIRCEEPNAAGYYKLKIGYPDGKEKLLAMFKSKEACDSFARDYVMNHKETT